jgi:hypothetical protein
MGRKLGTVDTLLHFRVVDLKQIVEPREKLRAALSNNIKAFRPSHVVSRVVNTVRTVHDFELKSN